jgi:hypothetical protein
MSVILALNLLYTVLLRSPCENTAERKVTRRVTNSLRTFGVVSFTFTQNFRLEAPLYEKARLINIIEIGHVNLMS